MPHFFHFKQIVNYPQQIKAVFLAQICFNFSFMGFKSLFVLYAWQQLGFPQNKAIEIFSILMTLSYASSLFGGFISDRFLKARRCQLIGSLLCISSMFFFLFSSAEFIYFAMSLFSLGSGFIKPNISALLASLFLDPQDPNKEKTFTHLYVCMNIGNFLGPLLGSFTAHIYGWTSSLMLLTLSFAVGAFALNHKLLARQEETKIRLIQFFKVTSMILSGIIVINFLLNSYIYKISLMAIIFSISLISFALIYYYCTPQERQGLHKISGFILCFTCFCSLFEQAGGTLMLFIEKGIDRQFFNFSFPTSAVLSLNPFYILILGVILPFFNFSFTKRKKLLRSTIKISIGFLFVSISFGILAFAAYAASPLTSVSYIFLAFLFQTLGELYIVPITLSNITRYAPPRYLSLILSFWLMAIGYGHYGAGLLANTFLSSFSSPSMTSLTFYGDFFTKLCLISILISLGISLFSASTSLNKEKSFQ